MPDHWTPFGYGPNATNISKWEWIDPPGKPSHKHLVDQRGHLLAHVTWEKNHQGIVGWRATARDEAARWMGSEVLDPTASWELSTLWTTPEDAMEQAEIDISHAAFAAGAAPNPAEVPAIFLLGNIIRGRALLLEIEEELRTSFAEDYWPGTIIHLEHDEENDRMPENPVLQAKAMAVVFDTGKGHWPPRLTRSLDEMLYQDGRQAVEQLGKLLEITPDDERMEAPRR